MKHFETPCCKTTLVLAFLCVQIFFCALPAHAESPITTKAEAMELMTGNNWAATRAKVLSLHDPLMIKIYEWMLYREEYAGLPFERVAAFIEHNPGWPNQTDLVKTAERNMPDTIAPEVAMDWFAKHKPQTGRGAILMMIAAQKTGQTKTAVGLLDAAWPNLDMTAEDTKRLMAAARSSLSLKALGARFDKLLFAEKYTLARSYATYLGQGFPQLAEARIALAENKPNASALISKVPAYLRNDTGLLFERLSWRRRHDEDQGALDILAAQPDMRTVSNAEEWWKERHIMIRRMIEEKNFKAAYTLAANHGQTDKADKAEAEWLAGWLALRFLNVPQTALTHFTTMYNQVATAISLSRGSYWAGRAAEQLGKKDEAAKWYATATRYPHTYYGQLALSKLGGYPVFPPVPVPSANDLIKMRSSDLLQAALIARTADLDRVHSQLITALTATLQTPGEYMAAAQTLLNAGDSTAAFRIAKSASWKNYNLGDYAYPSLENKMKNIEGDHRLFHAIIRQESQFDPDARSPSGALGLMQLMPATAKETAGKLGVSHQTTWLTTRPDHNILLGSTYLNRLLSKFDGEKPLAVAGYNAGPSRVDQWTEEFGDPREGRVDWIDWIELIPVSETRNYVQRVMENYYIYSNRYNNEHTRMKK